MGRCKRCNYEGEVQRHHPLPRRWYGNGSSNNWIAKLCLDCHKEADELTYQLDTHYGLSKANAHRFVDLFTNAFNDFIRSKPYRKSPPEPYQLSFR